MTAIPTQEEALYAIGEALGAAERLAAPYGEFDEAGEPLDGDAEVVALVRKAREALQTLEQDPEDLRGRLAEEALEAYTEQLSFDASRCFAYEDETNDAISHYELQGIYLGVLAAARKLGLALDQQKLEEQARDRLIEDLRASIPKLREKATRPISASHLLDLSQEEQRRHSAALAAACFDLADAEETLDALLAVEDPENAPEQLQTPATRYRVVLASTAATQEDLPLELSELFYTREVAEHRREDLKAGAYLPYGSPIPEIPECSRIEIRSVPPHRQP